MHTSINTFVAQNSRKSRISIRFHGTGKRYRISSSVLHKSLEREVFPRRQVKIGLTGVERGTRRGGMVSSREPSWKRRGKHKENELKGAVDVVEKHQNKRSLQGCCCYLHFPFHSCASCLALFPFESTKHSLNG